MPNKFELITKAYSDGCADVIRSPQNWCEFLSSACYNYRLRFDEQLLIFLQRPDATAVLEFEKWNKRFNRKILTKMNYPALFLYGNIRTNMRMMLSKLLKTPSVL